MHCSGFGSQAFGGQPGLKVVHKSIDTHICIYIYIDRCIVNIYEAPQ